MSSRQLHTPAGIDRGARSGGAADKKYWARALSTRETLPRGGHGLRLQRHGLPRRARVAIKLAAQLPGSPASSLGVAPLADLAWPYSVRSNPNPNFNPCPVAPVSPAAQTYRMGADDSRLKMLL